MLSETFWPSNLPLTWMVLKSDERKILALEFPPERAFGTLEAPRAWILKRGSLNLPFRLNPNALFGMPMMPLPVNLCRPARFRVKFHVPSTPPGSDAARSSAVPFTVLRLEILAVKRVFLELTNWPLEGSISASTVIEPRTVTFCTLPNEPLPAKRTVNRARPNPPEPVTLPLTAVKMANELLSSLLKIKPVTLPGDVVSLPFASWLRKKEMSTGMERPL